MLGVIGGTGVWWLRSKKGRETRFRTVPVKRGDLVATISATGTVEPEAAVDVGAQVAGVIIAFGKDKHGKDIDWGSVVDAGTVLAKIDDSLYAAAVETAKAQLQQADANVLQMKAKLLQAQQDWGRAQKLGPSDALAQTTYDQYQANYEVAKANLAAAVAAVEQAKASLNIAQINLGYCTIRSPVKGVIVDRRVNIGQTVVSSLSAPSLFLIARDLKHIQVWVSVNEADIGSISKGQPVTFTVDAYPDRVFQGKVGQVRLNATMTQNVVTYTVQVDFNNKDNKLLPYMTANAQFKIGRRQGVLLVANAALRWSPRPNQIAPESRQTPHTPVSSSIQDTGGGSVTVGVPQARGTIWVEQGKFVRSVRVKTGLTDGTSTEVEGKDLTEGLQAVVGEATGETAVGPRTEQSPFTPQMGRGQRQDQARPESPGAGR
jgi:HlyD family secretion protein